MLQRGSIGRKPSARLPACGPFSPALKKVAARLGIDIENLDNAALEDLLDLAQTRPDLVEPVERIRSHLAAEGVSAGPRRRQLN